MVVNERAGKAGMHGLVAGSRRVASTDSMTTGVVTSAETNEEAKDDDLLGQADRSERKLARARRSPQPLGHSFKPAPSPRSLHQPPEIIMATSKDSNKSIIPATLNEPLATAPPTSTFSALAQSPYPAWSTSALL